MIIDSDIKKLVVEIESSSHEPIVLNKLIASLIAKLRTNCLKKEALERYAAYSAANATFERYPLDDNGYAVAFDPLEDEEAFYNCWKNFGIVVGKTVVPHTLLKESVERIHEMMAALSDGTCFIDNPGTWHRVPRDEQDTPILSRGFFEVYHDQSLANLRQSIRLYIHHVVIWGRVDLWTSFDRLGLKLPGHIESQRLPLHVDQNPQVHPDFKTIQGVLALVDCPLERGTYVAVPGSKKYFLDYSRMAEGLGEYIQLNTSDPIAAILETKAQEIPLRAGDIITWDSRSTHANSENISDETRYVAYIAAGPAREENLELLNERRNAFENSSGKNVREALMHASKPPRYMAPDRLAQIRQPEELTLLGKLLYGQESYATIK